MRRKQTAGNAAITVGQLRVIPEDKHVEVDGTRLELTATEAVLRSTKNDRITVD